MKRNSYMPKMGAVLLVSAVIILLAACGGAASSTTAPDSLGSAPPVVQAKSEVINGIVVPPDPGAAKDATLQGVDTDGNGIRDELDRWIATQFGDRPGALEPIRWSVRSSQKYLTTEVNTKEQALALIYENMDVGGCIGQKLRDEGVPSGKFFNEELVRTYNTRERLDARKKLFQLAGMIMRNVDDSVIICPYAR